MKLINLFELVKTVSLVILENPNKICVTCAGFASAVFKLSFQRQHFLVAFAICRLFLLTDLVLAVHFLLDSLASTQLAEGGSKRVVAQYGGVCRQRGVVADRCLVEQLPQ